MRILMTSYAAGGVWTYTMELARAMQPHGVEVALATFGPKLGAEQLRDLRRLANVNLFASDYKLEWMEDAWDDVQNAGQWLLDLEQHLHPDVIHLNTCAHGALPWAAPVAMVGHFDAISWREATAGGDAGASCDRYRRMVGRGLDGADLVICPTYSQMQMLQRQHGPCRRTQVIPHARDPLPFTPGRKEQFILAAGRLDDAAKNVAAVVEAAGELSWPVHVAGQDRPADAALGRGRNVKYLGWLAPEAMAPCLARCPIFALPARYESFGMTVLEAALAGCALLLGDTPSLRELWDDVAIFVDPADGNALRDGLRYLIAHNRPRAKMAKRARLRALRLDPQRTAREYLAAYQSLPRRAGAAAARHVAAADYSAQSLPI